MITFTLKCPNCDRDLVAFYISEADFDDVRGGFRRNISQWDVDYFNGMTGNCPQHYVKGSLQELFYGEES